MLLINWVSLFVVVPVGIATFYIWSLLFLWPFSKFIHELFSYKSVKFSFIQIHVLKILGDCWWVLFFSSHNLCLLPKVRTTLGFWFVLTLNMMYDHNDHIHVIYCVSADLFLQFLDDSMTNSSSKYAKYVIYHRQFSDEKKKNKNTRVHNETDDRLNLQHGSLCQCSKTTFCLDWITVVVVDPVDYVLSYTRQRINGI